MKAALFKAPGEPLVIEQLASPEPGPDEVLVEVRRSGICGSDLHMTESPGVLAPGSVLGHEFSGEVVEVGTQVRGLEIGDHVVALPISGCGACATCLAGDPRWCRQFSWNAGGFAEYAVLKARSALRLPPSLTLSEGALVEPMAVAAHALRLAGDLAGRNVLVLGAGPIGLAAAFWARRLGAAKVAVAAASRRREALALSTGAGHFLVNDEQAGSRLGELFGRPPDIVVECVGLPGTFARALELAGPRGTVVVAGACVQPDAFVPMVAMMKELRVLFSIMYTTDDFRLSIDALAAGHVELRAMVTRTIGFGQFIEAFEALRGASPHCKVLLDPHA